MDKNKPLSLKDIAREMGVSISTVSRALKNSPQISEEMRAKIKAFAQENNYRRNPFAISLLKNTMRIIGIIVPDIVTHFYSSIISGINDVARQHGYSVIISSSYEDCELERQCVEDLVNLRVEGLIVCLSQDTTDYSTFKELHNQNIPVVFFDRICLPEMFSSVVTNNAESAQIATEFLISTGCKQVGFIGGANHLSIVKERKHGYLTALRNRKLPIKKELVVCNYLGYKEGFEATRQLLSLPTPPDAILAMNDHLAFGAMKVIKEYGLKIPDDISLIGYTDEEHSNYVEPALTAVSHQTYVMGNEACRLLINRIDGNRRVVQKIVPAELCVRGSTIKE